jgi:cardiolipin synthase C
VFSQAKRFVTEGRARAAYAVGLCLVAGSMLDGCATLPRLDNRSVSHPIEAPAGSALRAAIDPQAAMHPGLSGIHPLRTGADAFGARITLIDAAVSSLDVQYYIWHDDMTGRFMFDALGRAADRGVRIRLLLDDNDTKGLDGTLAALAAHPNIEVRLFNPFLQRRFRSIGYLTDFSRLNHRMHNKSLTADGVATIIGGRNIGNEYFEAGEVTPYIDLDVLAVGPVVAEVTRSFDEFWGSNSAYPAALILKPPSATDVERLAAIVDNVKQERGAERFTAAVRDSALVHELEAQQLALEWAVAYVVADDPVKGLGGAARSEQLLGRLEQTLHHRVSKELLIVSPYFVPGQAGAGMLRDVAARGASVQVLTNGLESTDVAPVYAHYRSYRTELLKAGVTLYELRRSPAQQRAGGAGVSAASLHGKTFAVDGEQIFVGSFNFDPRSANVNTEIGLVIDSVALATELGRAFHETLPLIAYRLELDPQGHLVWIEARGGGQAPLRYTREPGSGFVRGIWVGVLSILPVEGLL